MSSARDCIAKEILQTEKFYVESLNTIIEIFITPLQLANERKKPIITQEQIAVIFSNIETIATVNRTLLEKLVICIEQSWSEHQVIGNIFLEMAPFLKCYTQYCNFFEESNQLLMQLNESNSKFKKFLKKQNKAPQCKNLGVESFLIMPVQRIPRYILLLKDLIKHTPQVHNDYMILTQSLVHMEEVAAGVNQSVAKFQRSAKLISIEQELNIAIGLVQPSRVFISEQTLPCKIEKREFESVKLYLLNDMIIFSGEGKYIDRSALYMVWIEEGDPDLQNSFTLFCPTATEHHSYLFNPPSAEEKDEIINTINRALNELLSTKPSYNVTRGQKQQEIENKKKTQTSMSPSERKKQRRVEKRDTSKRKLTRDDSKFQTIKF